VKSTVDVTCTPTFVSPNCIIWFRWNSSILFICIQGRLCQWGRTCFAIVRSCSSRVEQVATMIPCTHTNCTSPHYGHPAKWHFLVESTTQIDSTPKTLYTTHCMGAGMRYIIRVGALAHCSALCAYWVYTVKSAVDVTCTPTFVSPNSIFWFRWNSLILFICIQGRLC
jgi:hypothetical protein